MTQQEEMSMLREHLASTREAVGRLYDAGEDPKSLRVRCLEALAVDLEQKVRRLAGFTLVHEGVEYPEMAGRA